MASEANDESVFDKIVAFIHPETNDVESNTEFAHKLSNNSNSKYEGNDDSGMFWVEIIEDEVSGQTEDVINILEQGDNFGSPTILNIPIELNVQGDTYKVVGIEAAAFTGTKRQMKQITEIIINGWDESGRGGWFKNIGSEAFTQYKDNPLTSFTLPNNLETLGFTVINNCFNLKTIKTQSYVQGEGLKTKVGLPDNLTTLDENSFADCHSLCFNDGVVTLPKTLTKLGYGCFYNCYSVKKVVFDTPNLATIGGGELSHEGAGAFENCTGLENIEFSNSQSLSTIGGRAFWNCHSLPHVTLPSNLTTIGDGAFANCYNLDNTTYNEGLQSIGAYAFANLTDNPNVGGTPSKVEYLYLPDSLKDINEGAYLNNANLQEVVIGMKEALSTHIYQYAFGYCPKLITISFIWNEPRIFHFDTFKDNETITNHCGSTPALECRFRPLQKESQLGGRFDNIWYKPFWEEYPLDDILPANSTICMFAAFDDETHGHDLDLYLEKTYKSNHSGEIPYLLDDQTVQGWNDGLKNGVHYRVGISIPDTVNLRDDHTADDKMIQTITKSGNSKTIEFVWDSTVITQSKGGTTIKRPEDDGVLNISNNCIQVGTSDIRNVTLNVGFRILHEGSYTGQFKKSPLVTGHYIPSNSLIDRNVTNGPVQLCADNGEEGPASYCPLDYTEKERQSTIQLQSNSDTYPTYDITAFSNRSGCILNFNMPECTTPSTESEKLLDFVVFDNNIGWCSCVYNSGKLYMENCQFTNNKGAWGNKQSQFNKTEVWGGSCVFNNGAPAFTGGTDIKGEATLVHCIMRNNSSIVRGGSIYNVGDMTISDCEISGSQSTSDCINEKGEKTGKKCYWPDRGWAGAIYTNTAVGDYDDKLNGNLIIEGSWINTSKAYSYVGGVYSRNGATIEMKDSEKSVCHYNDNTESNQGKKSCPSDIGLGPGKDGKLKPFKMSNSGGGGMGGTLISAVRAMCSLTKGEDNVICETEGIGSTTGWAINEMTAGESIWGLALDALGRLIFRPGPNNAGEYDNCSPVQKLTNHLENNKETIKDHLEWTAEELQRQQYER